MTNTVTATGNTTNGDGNRNSPGGKVDDNGTRPDAESNRAEAEQRNGDIKYESQNSYDETIQEMRNQAREEARRTRRRRLLERSVSDSTMKELDNDGFHVRKSDVDENVANDGANDGGGDEAGSKVEVLFSVPFRRPRGILKKSGSVDLSASTSCECKDSDAVAVSQRQRMRHVSESVVSTMTLCTGDPLDDEEDGTTKRVHFCDKIMMQTYRQGSSILARQNKNRKKKLAKKKVRQRCNSAGDTGDEEESRLHPVGSTAAAAAAQHCTRLTGADKNLEPPRSDETVTNDVGGSEIAVKSQTKSCKRRRRRSSNSQSDATSS